MLWQIYHYGGAVPCDPAEEDFWYRKAYLPGPKRIPLRDKGGGLFTTLDVNTSKLRFGRFYIAVTANDTPAKLCSSDPPGIRIGSWEDQARLRENEDYAGIRTSACDAPLFLPDNPGAAWLELDQKCPYFTSGQGRGLVVQAEDDQPVRRIELWIIPQSVDQPSQPVGAGVRRTVVGLGGEVRLNEAYPAGSGTGMWWQLSRNDTKM